MAWCSSTAGLFPWPWSHGPLEEVESTAKWLLLRRAGVAQSTVQKEAWGRGQARSSEKAFEANTPSWSCLRPAAGPGQVLAFLCTSVSH